MLLYQWLKRHAQSIIVGNVRKNIKNLTKILHDFSLQRQGLQKTKLKMLEKTEDSKKKTLFSWRLFFLLFLQQYNI